MKKVMLNRSEHSLKLIAVAVSVMMVISSVAIIEVIVRESPANGAELNSIYQSYQSRHCEVKTVLSQAIPWVSFDSTAPGTPAEAHVTVSDTTGITIVADFHGFWRNIFTINGTGYDDLEMPGAYSINDPGKPKLPRLFEYVEIPHDVDVSIEVIAFSNASTDGYNIRPAPNPNFPVGEGRDSSFNTLQMYTGIPTFFGSVYSNNAFFPGVRTSNMGGIRNTSIIMRGHRLIGLSFYPVQFNPVSKRIQVFSQVVIKVKYDRPAQIQPIPRSLQSGIFEQILEDSLLHYDSVHHIHIQQGMPTIYSRTDPPPASTPTATIPMFHHASLPTGYMVGAEYLIITTRTLGFQARQLADWKEQKGISSAVEYVPEQATTEDVKGIIEFAYNNWYPAPTYVLLFGDVDIIPANYDMIHQGTISPFVPYYQEGYIASDLGYFNIQGNSYFPDMIYSRISVDTEEQAEVIVDKILNYEKFPPEESSFYNSILSAGTFEDWNRDGTEDDGYSFIAHLENIRYYFEGELDYQVHYNYSCAANHTLPEFFQTQLEYGPGSKDVVDYIPFDYEWLWAYDDKQQFRDEAKDNIIANFNQGRFFVYYYSHGGSKNMIYPLDWAYPRDGEHDGNDRDFVEGWWTPYFNTSVFSELTNGDKMPLVLSIACSTGWFDGETDQEHMDLVDPDFDDNPFGDYENECFAENLTRLAGGGAIAVIAPSRITPSRISGDLLDGIIQSFWAGYLESESRPIYEMGAALFSSKLYAASKWLDQFLPMDVVRTTYETYYLIGDPETQLWTEAPAEFSVSHPDSIGTSNPQKFVVTVRDDDTGNPIDYAKVCVQQNPYIYQVGYTDSSGQIIFDVDPVDSSSFLNVTVTKHNHKPYIGNITVAKSFDAKVTVTPDTGLGLDVIKIDVTGFDDSPVTVFFDGEVLATFDRGSGTALESVPDGDNRYVNIRAVQVDTVAITRFFRLSTDQNPDPYIYSHKDPSTWYLADNELVWDNPCIVIHDGRNPVTRVTQNIEYGVNVTVYNRGNGDAIDTDVTLFYAPFGGGLSWTPIETKRVTIPLFGSCEVPFKWTPLLPNTACLNVTIYQGNEKPEDRINNVGQECWNIIPVCSPGQSSFQVGNPSDSADYVFINVKQEGNHEDVWYANIQDYTSRVMDPDESETVTLLVDPNVNIGHGDGRLFTAEIYVNGELIGGMAFDTVCEQNYQCFIIVIILAVIAVAVIVWYIRRKKLDEVVQEEIPKVPG